MTFGTIHKTFSKKHKTNGGGKIVAAFVVYSAENSYLCSN